MTTPLTLRGAKGSALTIAEEDGNATALRATADAAAQAAADAATSAALRVLNFVVVPIATDHVVTSAELATPTIFDNQGATNLNVTWPAGLTKPVGCLVGLRRSGTGLLTPVAGAGTTPRNFPGGSVPQYDTDFIVYSGTAEVLNYSAETVNSGAVTPLTVTAMQIPSGAPNTAILTLSRAIYAGLPPATAFVFSVATVARTSTAVAQPTDSSHITVTFNGAAVTNGQAVLGAYTEASTLRLVSLDSNTPLQNFSGISVTNNVGAVAPVFSAQSAPAGKVGVAYSYTFVASSTTSYAVASGALPAGLTLNTGSGVVSGTPTAAGSYTYVISATGSGGTTNSTSQTGTTLPANPVFTAQSAPAGTISVPYSYTFVATGAVSYAVASGSLPAGLSLNTSTGVLSGTPTTAASSTFVISATNTGGTTNSTSQTVIVSTSSGSLSITFTEVTADVSLNLTSLGYRDYRSVSDDQTSYNEHKTTGGIIGAPTLLNATKSSPFAPSFTSSDSWSDSTPGAFTQCFLPTQLLQTAGGEWGMTIPCVASATPSTLRLYFGFYGGGSLTNNTLTLTATLGDSSASPVSLQPPSAPSGEWDGISYYADIVYAGAGATTMTLKIVSGNGAGYPNTWGPQMAIIL